MRKTIGAILLGASLSALANEEAVHKLKLAKSILNSTFENESRINVINRFFDTVLIVRDVKNIADHKEISSLLDLAESKLNYMISDASNTSDSHYLLSHKKVKSVISLIDSSLLYENK